MKKSGFPVRFFLMYIIFYSVQAIYNSYVNLYLSDVGFTQAQIGMAVSVATGALLLIQPLWGLASDRAKYKNTIFLILLGCSAAAVLLFPLAHGFWWLLAVVALYSAVYFPIMPLQDNLTLEYLDGKKWDFGQIRLGGTLGYALSVVIVGWLLKDNYSRIFYMAVCLGMAFLLPKVSGHRHGENRAPIRQIFRDRAMLCLIFYNLVYSLGSSLYYNFYPIYFQSIGGSSSYIGTMMFASAIAELPFLFFASKLVKRFGIPKMIVASGFITSIRWALLFALKDPVLIIITNLLHGVGFVVINYCLAVYINSNVPKELRATGQTMMALLATIFSRLIFGYVGGLAADWLGVNNLMLFSAVTMLLGTAVFALWFRSIRMRAAVAAD